MPYSSASDAPSYVPKEKKKKWVAIFNSVYNQAIKDGKSKEKAEESAFAVANSKSGPNSKALENEFGKAKASLYERLGGVFAIAAVIDKFSDDIISNPMVGKNSKNPNLREWSRKQAPARLPGLKWMRTLWVCAVSGGPQKYVPTREGESTLSLDEAHRKLRISPDEFDEVAKILANALDAANVPKTEKGEVLKAFAAHKDEVTEGYVEQQDAADKSEKVAFSLLSKADDDENFVDTGVYDSDKEDEIREELVAWANYAESGPSFDPEGKYLCGTCDMRTGDDHCFRVVSPISFETGSCRIYVKGKPENEEDYPIKLTQIETAYTERPNVKGFGCARCMFGADAIKKDAEGRTLWCSFWGVHVEPLACCFKNTGDDDVFAPVKGTKDKSEKVAHIDDAPCDCVACTLKKKWVSV